MTADEEGVIVDASLPTPQATVWIIEANEDGLYGSVKRSVFWRPDI